MRRIRFITAIAAALLAIPAQAQNGNRAQALFEAARQKETLEGDLKGAIEQYRKIAWGGDRALAARALIRMAECHQKLGDAEARTIYERVVREFGDQKEAAAIARGRLGAAVHARRQSSTQVWSGPEVDTEGSVSPDGNFVSDVDWDTGNLTLREIATGAVRPLTNKGTWQDSGEFAERSAISRDGKQVAFNWYKDKEDRADLRIANLAGDPAPRHLYGNPDVSWIEPFDWSPDGKSIAVILSRPDRTLQLGLVSVPDGALRVLKSIDWRGVQAVFFSPNGKDLGYDLPESDTSRKHDVFVLSVDGSREIHAVAHRGEDLMMGWSPDGKRLLFASDRGGSTDLWGLPFEVGKPQGTPEILKTDIGRVQPMGVTRSGTLFYGFGLSGGRTKIQTASFDFASGKFLSPPADVPHEAFETIDGPAWSPDGKLWPMFPSVGELPGTASW